MAELFGAVEAGGTKFVCAVGSDPHTIAAMERFPTTEPDATIQSVLDFFTRQQESHGRVQAIGIGSFGPVDPDPDSATYGHITATPKPGWSHTDLAGPLAKALGVPVAFDTDVNAAAMGEWRWGAARDLQCFIYLTVGTGIGGGGVVNGQLMHGLVHPEMGHVRIPHDTQRDPYRGHCPFHGDCLEGLASGPALADRWGQPATELPEDHPAWDLQAEYLALALVNFICTLSPQRIVIGGGVMHRQSLYTRIRGNVQQVLNGYVDSPAILQDIDSFIVPPGLGDRAGVLGALAMGSIAARCNR